MGLLRGQKQRHTVDFKTGKRVQRRSTMEKSCLRRVCVALRAEGASSLIKWSISGETALLQSGSTSTTLRTTLSRDCCVNLEQ